MTDIADITFVWSDITLAVHFERSYHGFGPALLQVESIDPPRAPLPITETGYIGHFTAIETIDAVGGPEAYVRTWLDGAAKATGWHAAQGDQLSLF